MSGKTTLSIAKIKESIPKNYQFLKLLGSGGFGKVIQCRTKDTRREVAVKMPLFKQDTMNEIGLLRRLMKEGMDQRNIVKFYEAFDTPMGKAIIFEMLDMSLLGYYKLFKPLSLSDTRCIIKQVATALEVLKDWSIIHADIKFDNVMVVDHIQRPVQVKLIDFGLAMHASKARRGMKIQNTCYRPPEIILGLPFNESVDVWCLGTMVAILLFDGNLFPNSTEFETLKVMLKLFGKLPDYLLSRGMKTHRYFNYDSSHWNLMTDSHVMTLFDCEIGTYFAESYNSFQELFEDKFQKSSEKDIMEAASDLLRKMLEMETPNRITPSQILQHRFIHSESEPCPAVNTTTQQSLDLDEENSDYINKPLNHMGMNKILPEGYQITKMLANGKFGQMVKCCQPQSKKIVTVKLPNSNNRTQQEIWLLQKFVDQDMNHQNIVTFLDILDTSRGQVMVLERLNMNLSEYYDTHYPLHLRNIQAIVQQTATALQALESMGLIHTGVMMENIWLCSQKDQPLQIKLAEFGAVIWRKKAKPGMTVQLVKYRDKFHT
ncbi:homeodomain-interacting protein kinase 2-like [Eucyclogobius newberryi]|uniref:homeodomain-interacting protein kinase 2-like n=1 Tax=Eucyclogobius newberryi TaxID=166745 RepID=UPI003B5B376C